MSLINQVLNELEQRGAQTSSEQTMVRAVPARAERRWKMPVLFAAVLLIAGAALWFWPTAQQPELEQAKENVSITAAPVAPLVDEHLQPDIKMSFELREIPPAKPPQESETAEPPKAVASKIAVAAQPPKPAEIHHPAAAAQSSGALPLKQISRTQQADAEYRKALAQQQQGHAAEALAGYEAAIQLNEQHDAARLALAALLVGSHRGADAERVLLEGLRLKPANTVFSMALARVQVEIGNGKQALQTLESNLQRAGDKADYLAFYAALLQREGRHKEALNSYQQALRLSPNSGIWLMGYAISLQAEQRPQEAKTAYQRALDTRTLSSELTAFVQQKLKEL